MYGVRGMADALDAVNTSLMSLIDDDASSDDGVSPMSRPESPPHVPIVLGVPALGEQAIARRRRSASFGKIDDSFIFMATNLNAADLVDASDYPVSYEYTVTGRKRRVPPVEGSVRVEIGKRVEINDHSLAIFRLGERVFAVDATCSHAGGDLSAGDIEDIDGRPCVSCPRHHFCFDLETGTSLACVVFAANGHVQLLRATSSGAAEPRHSLDTSFAPLLNQTAGRTATRRKRFPSG